MAAVTWAYGVTTVPSRFGSLLPRTLASLSSEGFTEPRLFVDGAVKFPECPGHIGLDLNYYPTTFHWPALKTYGNWILALAELYIRNPACKRYAIFQDDLEMAKGTRQLLDKMRYPGKGYLNLHTFPQNEALRYAEVLSDNLQGDKRRMRILELTDRLGNPFNANPNIQSLRDTVDLVSKEELARLDKPGWWPSDQLGKSALALVFDRNAVQALLCHQDIANKPATGKGTRNLDGAVINAMSKSGFKEYVHSPSLVRHIGEVSSMGSQSYPSAPRWTGGVV